MTPKNSKSPAKRGVSFAKRVKILGRIVLVGSKSHAKLLAQLKHFNDLQKSEQD